MNDEKRDRLPRHETRLPFASPKHKAPTGDEFRALTQRLELSGSQVAGLVGETDARTVRKWIGGEREIPYSVWRLLQIEAGLALPDPDASSKPWNTPCSQS